MRLLLLVSIYLPVAVCKTAENTAPQYNIISQLVAQIRLRKEFDSLQMLQLEHPDHLAEIDEATKKLQSAAATARQMGFNPIQIVQSRDFKQRRVLYPSRRTKS